MAGRFRRAEAAPWRLDWRAMRPRRHQQGHGDFPPPIPGSLDPGDSLPGMLRNDLLLSRQLATGLAVQQGHRQAPQQSGYRRDDGNPLREDLRQMGTTARTVLEMDTGNDEARTANCRSLYPDGNNTAGLQANRQTLHCNRS